MYIYDYICVSTYTCTYTYRVREKKIVSVSLPEVSMEYWRGRKKC
jgi:hypothetical protein